jgi:hypothetical protein
VFYIIFKTAGTFGVEYFSLIEILQDDIQHHQWKLKITYIYKVKDNKSTYTVFKKGVPILKQIFTYINHKLIHVLARTELKTLKIVPNYTHL